MYNNKAFFNNFIDDSHELRRSPRLAAKTIQLFVYKATERNNQIKVSGSADILRDIPMQISVHQLASKLRCFEGDVVYVPTSGMYWLRKGTKQCVSMKNDEDLKSAITEYTSKNGQISSINIACCTVDRPKPSGAVMTLSMFFLSKQK